MTSDTSRRTLRHYEANAESFWVGTRDHDVSQNIEALLSAITEPPPLRILEFGCGPGRDLKTLVAHGHEPIGLDGSPSFVAMAHEYSGCEVWLQDFLELHLPPAHFHGVFANASLFHVPSEHLPRVLVELRDTLGSRLRSWRSVSPRQYCSKSSPTSSGSARNQYADRTVNHGDAVVISDSSKENVVIGLPSSESLRGDACERMLGRRLSFELRKELLRFVAEDSTSGDNR